MKKIKIILPLILLVFALSACSIKFNTGDGVSANDGGIFVSHNGGDSWRNLSLIANTSGKIESLVGTNILSINADPNDAKAFYLATASNGLYYSYDINEGWQKDDFFGNGTINAVAVDSADKCTIYVATKNVVYKSNTCNRDWKQVYYDNNPEIIIKTIAVDHYDNTKIYLGTSRGDVLSSNDSGQTWKAIQRYDNGISKVVVDPKDSRWVWVATEKAELYKFNASSQISFSDVGKFSRDYVGNWWFDFSEDLDDLGLDGYFVDLQVSKLDQYVYFATSEGLFKSFDDGQSWLKVNLLTPDEDSRLRAFALSPHDSQNIYYVTATTFFKSIDGGETWATQSLDSSRGGSALLVNLEDANIIYLGMSKIKN